MLAGLCLSVLSLVVLTRTGDDNIFLSFGVGVTEKESTGATARRWLRGEGWGDDSAGRNQGSVLSRAFRRLATARAPPGHPYFTDDEQAVIFEAAADEEEHSGHNHHGHFWHKPLHPIDGWDVTGVGLACIGLMIAAAGGIGGGGILVPLYILVLGFDPKHAIPLSNITIFGGAITNTVLNLSKRHPAADRPLVDWDLILVMEPLTIGGALVGSFINKVLPDWILAIMLIVLLAATANRTLRKGIKSYNKETEAQLKEKLNRGTSELTVVHESLLEEDNADEGDALLGASEKSLTGDREVDDREYELKQLMEGERFTPLFKVGVLTGVFVVVLSVNLLKGGGAFPSPLGIECGSYAFWGATGFIFVWVLGVSLRVREFLVERWRLKARLNYRYGEGDVEWNPKNTLRYPAVCFFAGFFAGLFGVGGGIVKGPLMLEMGVHPMVASATSAVMILYTSFTATTSFMVFGLLEASDQNHTYEQAGNPTTRSRCLWWG
ncbi:unnamed protein product [Ectocarpus sp. 6 AP-2014]